MLRVIPLDSEDYNLIIAAEKVIKKTINMVVIISVQLYELKQVIFMQQYMLKPMLEE
ncbi:blasticidin-S deaminase [Bacillus cereus ATCC 4342]|nr:Cytidine deaminase [Bacillus cereus]AJH72788.1 blasticidin-S deaminase [Bacillus cereus ATCC 4342]EEK81087.1 Cytidine deaminase family enzyme [Bacillus cereus ATCC 4342]KFM85415.1 blasticidin-S deaminase [Bacillus cereus ATCC 4342]